MFCLVGINIQQRCFGLPLPRPFQLHLERLDLRGKLMHPREQNSARDWDEEAELHFKFWLFLFLPMFHRRIVLFFRETDGNCWDFSP